MFQISGEQEGTRAIKRYEDTERGEEREREGETEKERQREKRREVRTDRQTDAGRDRHRNRNRDRDGNGNLNTRREERKSRQDRSHNQAQWTPATVSEQGGILTWNLLNCGNAFATQKRRPLWIEKNCGPGCGMSSQTLQERNTW